MTAALLWSDLNPESVLTAVETACGQALTSLYIPRNSYINRVFELEYADSRERLIVKFYRPNRWTPTQIREEHSLLVALKKEGLPVIPTLTFGGETCFFLKGIPFAIFPKKGGRAIDELTQDAWEQVGRLLGRMHAITATLPPSRRLRWTPETASTQHLATLMAANVLPPEYVSVVERTATQFIANASPHFKTCPMQLIHGDCHLGNLIFRPEEAIHIVDFDDSVVGPVLQDLWMLLPATVDKCPRELSWFKAGYSVFSEFPESQLKLIPLLRGMRQLHFAAWCAIQVGDTHFSAAFPEWGTPKYWNEWVRGLSACTFL